MTRILSSLVSIFLSPRFWSTVFHVRDYPWTEKLDYFSASALVLFNLYAIVMRLLQDLILRLHKDPSQSISEKSHVPPSPSLTSLPCNHFLFSYLLCSRNRKMLYATIGAAFFSFYCYHVNYMTYTKFDYGYNMKVNIAAGERTDLLRIRIRTRVYSSNVDFYHFSLLAAGVTGSGLWLLWAFIRIHRHKDPSSTQHITTAILTIIFLNVCTQCDSYFYCNPPSIERTECFCSLSEYTYKDPVKRMCVPFRLVPRFPHFSLLFVIPLQMSFTFEHFLVHIYFYQRLILL